MAYADFRVLIISQTDMDIRVLKSAKLVFEYRDRFWRGLLDSGLFRVESTGPFVEGGIPVSHQEPLERAPRKYLNKLISLGHNQLFSTKYTSWQSSSPASDHSLVA